MVTERVLVLHTEPGLKVSHYTVSTLITNCIKNEVEYSLHEAYFSTNIEKNYRKVKIQNYRKKKKKRNEGRSKGT